MNNQEVSKLLNSVSAAYEIQGENQFRIRAYDTAADSVEHATREIKDLWEEEKLKDLPGIGKNIASHLDELFKKGQVKHFNEVFKKINPSILEFIEIPGVGPKTAQKLAKELNIKRKNAIPRLKKAAEEGKIRDIEGFGEDSEKAIIEGIEELERLGDRMLLPLATRISEEMILYMKKSKHVIKIDTLGSLRRKAATIGDIDLAVATNHSDKVIKHFTSYPKIKKVLAAGENTARLILKSGYQVDLKTQEPEKYGALLQHFTGSKSHNIRLRELAQKKGYSLSEHGIKSRNKLKTYQKEESFYKALGLQWIPPELREDAGEIELAKKKKLPRLTSLKNLEGDLHTHTNYDWKSSHDQGISSVKDIIDNACKLGYEYIGIGDHNPSVSGYSKNLLITVVRNRSEHIEQQYDSYVKSSEYRSIKLLKTLEIDILTSGKLAVPKEAMNYLDFAVVSIHSSMRMDKKRMTKRIMRGLSHRKAKILGHPTGRILNSREGYEVEWNQVFEFMAKENKFLEINSQPARLDLPDTLVRKAKEKGVKFAINTDAHDKKDMHLIRYGVEVARRGWAEESDIINTYKYSKIKKYLLQ